MAISDRALDARLQPIVDEVARTMARYGVQGGDPASAKGILRVEREEHVKRTVQVYWTPFEAVVPGESVGVHLEVDKPRVHWAEGYLSPTGRSWVFCFHERDDGEIQLARYGDYPTWQTALDEFFKMAGWHVLTATDITWKDVVHQIGEGLPWTEEHQVVAETKVDAAVQEAIKKSTIVWLRWTTNGTPQTMPVWFVLDQGKLYVLSGERQQTIPNVTALRDVDVILRWKGKNARVAEIPAGVRILEPGAEWDRIAEKIAEKRLNIPGLPEDTARRWRDECHILELSLQA
jgi:hypothetical protein